MALAEGDVVRGIVLAVIALTASPSLAQAGDLQSCAAAAERKKLVGYALGTFITECLSGPAGSSTAVEKPSEASVASRLRPPPTPPSTPAANVSTSGASPPARSAAIAPARPTRGHLAQERQGSSDKPAAGVKEYRIAQDQVDDRLDRSGRQATRGICNGCSGDGRQRSFAMPAGPRPDAAPSFE